MWMIVALLGTVIKVMSPSDDSFQFPPLMAVS